MGNSFGRNCTVLHESCTATLDANNFASKIDLSFLDPSFNQDKAYNAWNDNLPRESDDVSRFFKDYACTPDLEAIWVRKAANVF